jgi:hypothetical protein
MIIFQLGAIRAQWDHARSWQQIKDKPHVTRRVIEGEYWFALFYLRGRQSRIRCTVYRTLREAAKQARAISAYNARTS